VHACGTLRAVGGSSGAYTKERVVLAQGGACTRPRSTGARGPVPGFEARRGGARQPMASDFSRCAVLPSRLPALPSSPGSPRSPRSRLTVRFGVKIEMQIGNSEVETLCKCKHHVSVWLDQVNDLGAIRLDSREDGLCFKRVQPRAFAVIF
jgi:hypothetical protein